MPLAGCSTCDRRRRAHLAQILDLFVEDSWRSVYAGEREVRPPGAPTTRGLSRASLLRTRPLSATDRPSEVVRGAAALETGPRYFELIRKARISRSVSDSFDRNMWCAAVSLTTRAVGTPASSARACLSVEALIAV